MFNAGTYHITIAEMDAFVDDAEKVFTTKEYDDLVQFLAEYPDAGELIPSTGGVRKVRWRAKGSGKRGGARVIYYFRDLNVPVYLLAVYAKGEKLDLTESEKKIMRSMIDDIVENASARRVRVLLRA